MNALLRALSAETLKLRGTLALWMCFIAPATVAALYMLQMVVMDYGKRPEMPAPELEGGGSYLLAWDPVKREPVWEQRMGSSRAGSR